MSVKDLPLTNFKIALGECTDRLKVCSTLSLLMDDISELEATHGKTLVKLGGQSVAVGSKIDWLPNYTALWDNSYKSLSTIGGKQHSNLASSLTQNISKKYPDFVKANKKRLATVSSKIAGLIDDLKKAKQVHNKNVEKYLKMVQEAEAAIRARVLPGDTTVDALRTTSVAESEPSKDTAATASAAKDNGFMNRSLNKMLSKIAPEKKSQEKLKDLLKEVEMAENSLILNVQRINNMRSELTNEIGKGLAEIEELESARLGLMKEGLGRVCASVDLLVDKESEASEPIAGQLNKLNPRDELAGCLLREVDRLVAAAVAARRREKEEEGATAVAAEAFDIVELLLTAEKTGEAMDYLKQLAVKITNGLLDIADVERVYAKGASRILEKHGFTPNGEVSPRSASAGGAPSTSGCSESLQQLESPLLSAGWQCVVRSFSCIGESHQRTSETLTEEVCQKLDSVQKQVDLGRKELTDQVIACTKKYEAAHSAQEKVLVKLAKVQAVLKERRNAVRLAKEEQGQGSGNTTATATTAEEAPSERDSETEDAPSHSAAATAAAAAVEDSSSGNNGKRKGSMMGGFENLGATFKNTKLKQQLGLESPADRILRIENKILSLEEEESDLNNALKAAQTNCVAVDGVIRSELTAALTAAKSILSADLESVKLTFEGFLNFQSESIGLTKTCAQNMKLRSDEVNVASDLKRFAEVVRTAALTAAVTDTLDTAASIQVLLEIPSLEVFEPVKSELIEEEKKSSSATATATSGTAASSGGGFANVVHSAVKQQQQNGHALPPLHTSAGNSQKEEQQQQTTTSSEGLTSPVVLDTAAPQPALLKATSTAATAAPTATAATATATATTAGAISGPSSPQRADSPPRRPSTAPPVDPSYEVVSDPAALLSAASTPTTTSRKLAEALLVSPHSPSTAPPDVRDVSARLSFDDAATSSAGDGQQQQQASVTLVTDSLSLSHSESPLTPPAHTSGDLTPASPSPLPSTTAAPSTAPSTATANATAAPTSLAAVAAAAMLAQTSTKSEKSSASEGGYELAKFGLSPADKVLESFSCALYPKKGLLTHGRMFITQHYMAFSGWPDTRVLLALSQVKGIEKSNTMGYIPNALTITTDSGDEYFFGSFIDRLPCYQLLTNLSEIAKRIIVIQGPGAVPEVSHAGLELGYQSRSNLFGSLASAAAQFMETEETPSASVAGGSTASSAAPSTAATPSLSRSLFSSNANNNTTSVTATGVAVADRASAVASPSIPPTRSLQSKDQPDPTLLPPPAASAAAASGVPVDSTTAGAVDSSSSSTSSREALLSPAINYDEIVSQNSLAGSTNGSSKSATVAADSPVVPGVPPNSAAPSVSSDKISDTTFKTAATSRKKAPTPSAAPPKVVLAPFSDELPPDGVNLSTFFSEKGIALLGEKTFDFSSVDLFKAYFLDGSGYGDFLFSEGDLDIQVGEWKPLASPLVAEDVSKLHFSHSRPYSYAHPRTTMLMFGPKNAPGTQVQYLYLPHDLHKADTLHTVRPRRGIILNITQFDGIPMADVFKVLQYWSFSAHPTDDSRTVVRVGLAMHYIKSSLFKSQIFGGTKDELSDQLKKWYIFIERRVSQYRDRVKEEAQALMGLNDNSYSPEYDDDGEEEDGFAVYEGGLQQQQLQGAAGEELRADLSVDPSLGIASRRQSFAEASAAASGGRPMSRRLSRDAINKLGATPTSAVTASASVSYTPSHIAATTNATVAASAAAEPVKDTSKTVLVGVLLVFFVLILIQWSYNRSLSRQIAVLNAKFDLSQQQSEAFMRETQSAVERLLRHLKA